MTLSLKELMEEDGTFEKAILKVESTIKDDVAKIHSYYDNEYIYLILMDEVEEVADLIRRAYALDGIPCISFEIYISAVYHEMAEKPSLERCEVIKSEIFNRWSRGIDGCGCGC